MAERRSMTNALSPEKVAFLRGEPEEVPPSAPERSTPQRSTSQRSTPQRSTVEKVQRSLPPQPGRGRVTVTVRLEPDVAEALSQASAERKMKRLEPYTQQDIIGDALKQWLQDAGFLQS
jgi:hypothetical protein